MRAPANDDAADLAGARHRDTTEQDNEQPNNTLFLVVVHGVGAPQIWARLDNETDAEATRRALRRHNIDARVARGSR